MTRQAEWVASDTFDVVDVVQILLRGKWIILAAALVCGAVGTAYAAFARPWFRAEVVVAHAEGSSVPRGLAQLGGLASLAGISMEAQDSESLVHLAVLKSRDFARQFIEASGIAAPLAAEKNGSGAARRSAVDLRDAVDVFDRKVREVVDDTRAGVISVSMTWRDPEVAARLANEFVALANQRLRDRALAEATRNVAYLRDEMGKTQVASLQQSMSRLLESELEKLMLARGREEFAFRTIDPATPPLKQHAPRRLIVAMASVLVGLVAAALFVLFRASLAGKRRQLSG